MPEIKVASLSDTALASSVAGATHVSQGAGAVPVFDANNFWSVANRRHTLKGQAAGAGGDRWQLQNGVGGSFVRYDEYGTAIHDINVNTSLIVSKTIAPEAGYPVTWNHVMNSDPQAGNDGNAAASIGWNINGGNARVNAAHPTFRDGKEFNYQISPGRYVMEGHWGSYIDPVTGNETRPWSLLVDRTNGYAIDSVYQGRSWAWTDRFQAQQIAVLQKQASGAVLWTIANDGGSDLAGWPLQFISGNGAQAQDTLGIGRSASTNSFVNLRAGTGVAGVTMRLGSSTAQIYNDGNLNVIAVGDVYVRKPSNFFITNASTSQTFLSIDTVGSIAMSPGGAAPNVSMFGTMSGDGVKTVFLGNASAIPSTNPTNAVFLYSQGGEFRVRSSAGVVFRTDRRTVTGVRSDGTALASLLTQLAATGLILDSTTA
jgi:hypothetical protein